MIGSLGSLNIGQDEIGRNVVLSVPRKPASKPGPFDRSDSLIWRRDVKGEGEGVSGGTVNERGHGGVVRKGLGSLMHAMRPWACERFFCTIVVSRRSPGAEKGINTTRPSARRMP